MSLIASLFIGLALGLLLAGAAGFYVWRVWRPRREVFEGRRILAAMRWRELSNLVIDALGSAGFEPESREKLSERGAQAELVMRREGRPWLLACKQGLDHRIGPQSAEDLLRDVRRQQAAGAVMVTPGHVDPAARQVAPNIELADGTELWRLLEPLLPASVHDEVSARARRQAVRHMALVSVAALVVAAGIAWVLKGFDVAETVAPTAASPDAAAATNPSPAVAPAAASAAVPATAPDAAIVAPVPLDEDLQRRQLAERLSALPGVDRALWPTRSTIQLYLSDPTLATDTAICQVVERYELLRASRLQLQPPPGDARPVRFMQCRAY